MRGSIFGLPTALSADRAQRLVDALAACWAAQFGQPPGQLMDDLHLLHSWFNPRATGARLRGLIDTLPELPEVVIPPGFDVLFLEIEEYRHVVSPEGRVMLELLAATQPEDGLCLVDSTRADQTLDLLAETYRVWNTDNLRRVVQLLAGETETLRPGAAGLLLVLLVNRNTSPERRLPRTLGDEVRASEVQDAITGPAAAWSRTFSNRSTVTKPFRLYQGWELPELRRRLGSLLQVDSDGVYIDGDADAALDRVTADLARRPESFRSKVPEAFKAMLTEYARRRPVLRGLNIGFEIPSNTAEIERRLIKAAAVGADG